MPVKPAVTQPSLTVTAVEHWPPLLPHICGTSPLREDLSIGPSLQCFDICIYINGRKRACSLSTEGLPEIWMWERVSQAWKRMAEWFEASCSMMTRDWHREKGPAWPVSHSCGVVHDE